MIPRSTTAAKLPRAVWALGFVSLLMDASSELVHSLLPLYMAAGLGATMVTIGVVEGMAEAVAQIVKVFSGTLSDYFGKRKGLTVAGYALAALSKPMFPLATSVAWVFTARVLDRIGKGIRGAPRDALIADVTPSELRGAAYGLRQALDSVGAFIGPMLAIALMLAFHNDFKVALWVAVVPALAAVLVAILAVDEPTASSQPSGRAPLSLADTSRLGRGYWGVVILGLVFTLARFSEAFLVLRARDLGLGLDFAPLVLLVMSVVYAALAYPAGIAADRISARVLLVLGLLVLVAADLVFAGAHTTVGLLSGAGLWGTQLALTQGLLSKLIADTAPVDLRGTAFGIFNLVSGVALLAASVIAGYLWDAYGAAATFEAGAVFAGVAALGVLLHASLRATTRD